MLVHIQEEGMPIGVAPEKTALRVVKVLADDMTRKHLESLGITVDSKIEVISKSGGSIICKVKDGRLALDGFLAAKILVV